MTRYLLTAVDVNDPRALQIYGQLFRFRENATMLELLINEPDKLQQVTLCALAHNLDLQYEYCVSSRRARITRSSQLERPARDTFMRQAHLADEFPAMPYLSNGSHDSGIQTQYSPDLSFSVDSNGFLRDAQMFPTTTAFTHSVGACMESQIPSICDLQNGFSNLQHIQHVQQNPSFHQLETTHTSNDDKEPRDSLYLQQASVAVIAPWHRPGSIASSKRSSPSLCSGTSSHRSTPSFRKKISTRSASKSLRLCQYCGESFKRTSFLGMHKCLNAGEMRR